MTKKQLKKAKKDFYSNSKNPKVKVKLTKEQTIAKEALKVK